MKIIQSPNYSGGPKENFRAEERKLAMHFTETQKRMQMLHKKTIRPIAKKKKKKREKMIKPKVI